jgi:hypothetical protein
MLGVPHVEREDHIRSIGFLTHRRERVWAVPREPRVDSVAVQTAPIARPLSCLDYD